MRPKKDLQEVVRKAFGRKRYVPNVAFRAFAEKEGHFLSYGSSRNLVMALQKAGLMRSAGRGWSTLCANDRFCYDSSVAKLASKLGEWFPYAEAKCWSTHQFVDFFHHLPGRFYTYVYIDRSIMEQLRDRLNDFHPKSKVFVNPGAVSFMSERKTSENFVIRPITRDDEMATGKVLPIEGMLVDFASEAELVIDGWDYEEVARGVIASSVLDAQAILRRIVRRRFANRNTLTLCNLLSTEGITNDSVQKFCSQLEGA